MAEFDDDDDIRAYFSEDDEIPYSHKGYGGHSGGSRGYELPRRSQTYSGNPGNRRSGGARSHRTTSYDLDEDDLDEDDLDEDDLDEDDLDEDFDSRRQLCRRGGTELSNRGNGRFGREAPRMRATHQPEADYDGGGYGQGYSPYDKSYPEDTGYGAGSHPLGRNFKSNSDVKIVNHVTNEFYFSYDGAPDRQKGWSNGKEKESFRDTRPPPGEKSGKICKPLKKAGVLVLPGVAGAMATFALEHLI